MRTIVKNFKSVWNVCDRAVDVVRRGLSELEQGRLEAETYWREHPETRPELAHF